MKNWRPHILILGSFIDPYRYDEILIEFVNILQRGVGLAILGVYLNGSHDKDTFDKRLEIEEML